MSRPAHIQPIHRFLFKKIITVSKERYFFQALTCTSPTLTSALLLGNFDPYMRQRYQCEPLSYLWFRMKIQNCFIVSNQFTNPGPVFCISNGSLRFKTSFPVNDEELNFNSKESHHFCPFLSCEDKPKWLYFPDEKHFLLLRLKHEKELHLKPLFPQNEKFFCLSCWTDWLWVLQIKPLKSGGSQLFFEGFSLSLGFQAKLHDTLLLSCNNVHAIFSFQYTYSNIYSPCITSANPLKRTFKQIKPCLKKKKSVLFLSFTSNICERFSCCQPLYCLLVINYYSH